MHIKRYLLSASMTAFVALAAALAPTAKAQMMGWCGPGQGSGWWGGMAGMGSMGAPMSAMRTPVIGPDGTAYVLRSAPTPANQSSFPPAGKELAAVDPSTGGVRWTVPIDGWMVSRPAVAGDGRIFLTASGTPMAYGSTQWGGMMWGPMMGGNYTPGAASPSTLFIVGDGGTSATLIARVELDARALSEPQLAPDPDGGYLVYVTGFNMGWNGYNAASAPAGAFLYAFHPDGQLKFKVALGRW